MELSETDIMFTEWKNTHLQHIIPQNIKKSIHYDVKVKPFDYLKGMLYMNSVLEKRESKAKTNQRILLEERKRNCIIEKETILSLQNSKSVDYEKFKTYLVEKDKLNKDTMEFYKKETWRKMKFRQYSYGKKSIDTFLNKIKETFGENILIGYGNWCRSSQMKHFMPTMNKGLRKLIHKKYDTITINECIQWSKMSHIYTPLKISNRTLRGG